ncbi:MAG: iron-sulfur cluster assembly scaffold protein [Christensenellaceae bacterium]|jgi:nitrogen fixation NifU-like protein|nr:iron-sulfur cluster assembly scaffold protein [Christensenellaceae bacterium]
MYNKKVLDVFANPKNVGSMPDANGVGTAGNASCGDIMKVYLKIEDDVIKDASFETFGCAAAIASSSVATEMIKGLTTSQAEAIKNSEVVEVLEGLPPQKIHCSVLAEEAIHAALSDYKCKRKETE